MKQITTFFLVLTLTLSNIILISQSIDDDFSNDKMAEDLEVFKKIRIKANSGLYKYRTKKQIDSIYNWAENEVKNLKTYREFYNLIHSLTDYEGSCHNSTSLPNNLWKSIREDASGYFPYPIKWIEGKWLVNIDSTEIPLGAEIVSINAISITEIIKNLNKYNTTDGYNLTGKRTPLRKSFPLYYRFHYGLVDKFRVEYKINGSEIMEHVTLKSVTNQIRYKNFYKIHSAPTDRLYYNKLKENQKYYYKSVDSSTGMLTINSFDIGGNAEAQEHLRFTAYLDSLFKEIKSHDIKNLIVDIRHNRGGTDPNELVLYEYLSQREFCENKSAWISFQKVPYLKYIDHKIPVFLRRFGAIPYNRDIKKEYPIEKNGKYYQGPLSIDHKMREPQKNAFTGNIYLIINPESASATSNFGSLVASNDNVTIIGEETVGGFYGHNGHSPITYILPKSKITTKFFLINVEQYVIEKPNKIFGRGIMPDLEVTQNYEDFITNTDTQLNYTLELIKSKLIK